jgi:hypothetical protein
MMVVNTSTLVSDAVLLIRDRISSQVTDPITSTRPISSYFVCTGFPDSTVVYPMITVQLSDLNDFKAGIQSEQSFVELFFEVRVWGRNVREKDHIAQDVYNALRTYQHGSNEAIANGLHDFRVLSVVNVDERGKGIKSKVFIIRYLFIATS